jgi:hypothetical protein
MEILIILFLAYLGYKALSFILRALFIGKMCSEFDKEVLRLQKIEYQEMLARGKQLKEYHVPYQENGMCLIKTADGIKQQNEYGEWIACNK